MAEGFVLTSPYCFVPAAQGLPLSVGTGKHVVVSKLYVLDGKVG